MEIEENSHYIPKIAPAARPGMSAWRRRMKRSRPNVSIEGLIICLFISFAGLVATAQTGLRLTDLAISALVIALVVALALRDSRYLSVVVVGVWIFSPMVRRIVDWQGGAYVSLTALSILPLLATPALIIPLLPRLRSLPHKMIAPLVLIVTPVLVACAFGYILYGPGAIAEAGTWLLPLLFLPYLATRPSSETERLWMLRAVVLMAAVAAAYGIYQYFMLPNWDRLWLVASGMTGSMGRAEPTEMRIWGPMNSTGTAAVIWALAIIAALADRQGRAILKYTAIAVLAIALCLTLVRIGWIIAIAGMILYAILRGGRDGIAILITVLLCGAVLCFGIQFLPHPDTIIERVSTLGDLTNDNSYNARTLTGQAVFNEILDRPWGRGMGFKTAAKLAGQSTMVVAIDNGYGDLISTLGILGGVAFLIGLLQMSLPFFRIDSHSPVDSASGLWILRPLAATMLAMLLLANCAVFSMLGVTGIWCWFFMGLASPTVLRRE